MPITVSTPIANARRILNDERAPYRNTDNEHLAFVNECLAAMVDLRSDLFIVSGTHTCTLGSEQTLTQQRVRDVVDVPRIVGGGVVLPTDRALLDRFAPGWYLDPPAPAMNWMVHPVGQELFYVDPPAPAGQVLQVMYVETPAQVTALTDTVPLPENYTGAITAYLVNRISSKDDESVNSGRAALFMSDFAGLIGVKPAAQPGA